MKVTQLVSGGASFSSPKVPAMCPLLWHPRASPPGLQEPLASRPAHCALGATHRTTSTAPARTLGSLPMMDTLAAKEPSILKTTNSVPLGSTVM